MDTCGHSNGDYTAILRYIRHANGTTEIISEQLEGYNAIA